MTLLPAAPAYLFSKPRSANEGEPNAAYPEFNPATGVDPKGSVTVIKLKN
ncbi:MAG: hypothetical protein JW832_03620 [Deltaproteobacteria bacterium]|nr:hypothetical protein [Deltaproteobacteria bacterium]